MCILKLNSNKCKMINRSQLGSELRGVLARARSERRLICGLLPAVACLERASEEALLCVLPLTRPGDAASHLQTVLLQAFCYENDIPVIRVDSGEKLAQYCGEAAECSCAVITRDPGAAAAAGPPRSPSEQQLADFYECTLEEFPRPVVELPR